MEVFLRDFNAILVLIICSHIYREGNCSVDGIAKLGHALPDTTWFTILPSSLLVDFVRVRNELPKYRFP